MRGRTRTRSGRTVAAGRDRIIAVLSPLGKLLIAGGVLTLSFAAYQLWGTSFVEARAQRALEDEFRALVETPAVARPATQPVDVDPVSGDGTTEHARPAVLPDDGSAVARLEVPAIGLDKIVVEGVGQSDLRKGPGHYPGTPLPGRPGNAAIAGHRTTYGAPFFRLDELRPGDVITVTTRDGRFRYIVGGTEVVEPSRVDVLDDFGDDRLTLTTCNPRYSAAQRLIITATLDRQTPPAPAPPAPSTMEADGVQEPVLSSQAAAGRPTSIDAGDGEPPRWGPAVRWGLATAAVAAVVGLIGRRWRRWPAYAFGSAPFAFSILSFFENLNRLLPASV